MATDELSRVFAALADPTRRDILERLGNGPATVGELAEPYRMTMPAVSKHLRVLEQAGLIERQRRSQWRESILRAGGLDAAAGWVDALGRLWDARLDRLDAHLASLRTARSAADPRTDDQHRGDRP